MLGGDTRVSLWRSGGTRTTPLISTKIWQKKIGRDLLKSVNRSTLASTVSTCSVSNQRMSLTTTSTTLVMPENRGSGNKRVKDCPIKVLRIYMTNFMDSWDHLCVLILSWQSQTKSASIARAPWNWLKGPWGRAAKTQMVRGKTTPSPRPCKPWSNEVVFMVFLVSWLRRRAFQNTNLYTGSRKWPRHRKLMWRSWKDSWEGRF
jgi:hypothetical protein